MWESSSNEHIHFYVTVLTVYLTFDIASLSASFADSKQNHILKRLNYRTNERKRYVTE
jgi:hypothetical protein